MSSNKAVIISAPSGSGKTTIVKHLLSVIPELRFSISATSRDPRPTEQNTRDYFFMTEENFREGIKKDLFIEWEEVYDGTFYGTLKSEIDRIWSEGNHVIFDVDVKGGINLKKYFGDSGLSIFITVNSIDDLETRLKSRRTESDEAFQKRIKKARFEMGFKEKFDKIILNDKLDQAKVETEKIVREFLNND